MTLNYDQWMGSLCLWREARGCSITQMNAIWWVLNNRANDSAGRWPKFVADVVVQPFQFSSFNANDPNVTQFPTRKHASDWSAYQNCMLVVSNPLGDDPTQGATNYHSIPDGQPLPAWADPAKLRVTLGPFKFYKL